MAGWLVWSCYDVLFFFFSSRRRHTRFDCDWSSDVCSSDLVPGDPDPGRLVVLAVDTGVADVRCRLHDDLTVVRRVGQGLLVPGHAGVEDRLAEGLAHAAIRLAPERTPVLQDEDRLPPHRTAFPSSTVGTPRRNVATTRTGRVIPAYGVLRLREANPAGSTVQVAEGSTRVKLAGTPGAGARPC